MKANQKVFPGVAPDIDPAVWNEAVRRRAAIRELAALDKVSIAVADEAGSRLGLDRRTIYRLLRRYRDGEGLVTEFLPRTRSKIGSGNLSPAVEDLIYERVTQSFMTRQRRSVQSLCDEIGRLCRMRGLPPPSRKTIERRIRNRDPIAVARSRGGENATRQLRSAGDRPLEANGPLRIVEIDHTPVDLIVVDQVERREIGRPYVTVAIDRYSRCIVGMHLSLECPSAMSVALVLAQIASDKSPHLSALGIDAKWTMSGKPLSLYLDNAAEFKTEALHRGCEQHGIALAYRPPGRPHFGGTVERVIGTFMRQIHELPGTTFSNVQEKGTYNSQKRAALTMPELEKWLALAVIRYHGTIHRGLGETPQSRWDHGVGNFGTTTVVARPDLFVLDFLPAVRRQITREGFVLDHVQYFSNALKPWIADRQQLPRFLIRRDPRDISRIWVQDPVSDELFEVPTRSLIEEPLPLWELRASANKRKILAAAGVNDAELSRLSEEIGRIPVEAEKSTRELRRARERRGHKGYETMTTPQVPDPPSIASTANVDAAAFEDLEDW